MTNILPPEWGSQDAIMITWPHGDTDWAANLQEVETVFFEMSLAILAQQQLIIICHDKRLKDYICQLFKQLGMAIKGVHFVIAAINDCWARDHGPLSVVNKQGQITALNFTFNGWGGKYPSELDDQINQALFEQLNIKYTSNLNIVLEAGAIEVDDQGHLLTTKRCLLNSNRNSAMTQTAIEGMLKEQLGAKKVLWLNYGALEGDDTDSHIDTLARFAPNQTIIYQSCDDKSDSHYVELDKMQQELQQMRSVDDLPFKLIKLPFPDAQYNDKGVRLPATYANFLIINGAVLMPSYGVPQDEQAQAVLGLSFPEYKIITINCRPIIEQFGSLHCLTMQLPQGFLLNHSSVIQYDQNNF